MTKKVARIIELFLIGQKSVRVGDRVMQVFNEIVNVKKN